MTDAFTRGPNPLFSDAAEECLQHQTKSSHHKETLVTEKHHSQNAQHLATHAFSSQSLLTELMLQNS